MVLLLWFYYYGYTILLFYGFITRVIRFAALWFLWFLWFYHYSMDLPFLQGFNSFFSTSQQFRVTANFLLKGPSPPPRFSA